MLSHITSCSFSPVCFNKVNNNCVICWGQQKGHAIDQIDSALPVALGQLGQIITNKILHFSNRRIKGCSDSQAMKCHVE